MSNMLGIASKVLHNLISFKKNRKVRWKFTKVFNERKEKPKLVVNTKVSQNEDVCKRKKSQNVFHLGS